LNCKARAAARAFWHARKAQVLLKEYGDALPARTLAVTASCPEEISMKKLGINAALVALLVGVAGFSTAFVDWLVSPDGQKAIADYKINGEQLFFLNADDPNA
jgi:hypothetical protein